LNDFDNENIGNEAGQSNDWGSMGQPMPENADTIRLKRLATSAIWNGVLGLALSAWTVLAIFGLMWNDTLWVLLFVGVDFFCSVPAIFNAIRARKYNTPMFVAALAMGIVSAATSLAVIIIWAV